MRNRIEIGSPDICGNKIEISYFVEGIDPWWGNPWMRFFQDHNREGMKISSPFVVEYSEDISGVPESVAVIPLICNVLPAAWLCDAEIVVDSIDEDFLNSVPLIKKGYMEMYPMLQFKGKITAKKIVRNKIPNQRKSACFFSGGADSVSTLITHRNENPTLITLWGSDIKISDVQSWEKVDGFVKKSADRFGVPYVSVKTNFREIVTEWEMDPLIKDSGDGYWHGFQHGIGIASHAAPYAYAKGITTVYMASSYCERDGQYTCASHPTIEGNLKFSGAVIVHDEYEKARMDKLENISRYKTETGQNVFLRVCWEKEGGGNCSSCEKCLRTMIGLFSLGQNPMEFGFEWDEIEVAERFKYLYEKANNPENHDDLYWKEMHNIMNTSNWGDVRSKMKERTDLNDVWDFFVNDECEENHISEKALNKNKLHDKQKKYSFWKKWRLNQKHKS